MNIARKNALLAALSRDFGRLSSAYLRSIHKTMKNNSVVVLESGAGWPTWVDAEAGEASSIVVLSRQRRETAENFEARARARLGSLAELRAPRRGVLVCGTGQGQPAPACRERLLRILCEVIGRAGGDEVVLIGDDARLIGRLSGYIRELNAGLAPASTRLSLRLSPAPDAAEQQLTQRVA
jgi:hypothetical protein